MLIRRETDADVTAIDKIHQAAFARPGIGTEPPEVDLVRRLRADVGWVAALSLVAKHTTGAAVGHVVCTVGSIGDAVALGLGPLGVLPAYQRGGVGQALMHAVLGAANALDFPVVALLGNVDYYSRFGFVAARTIGVIRRIVGGTATSRLELCTPGTPSSAASSSTQRRSTTSDRGAHRAGDSGCSASGYSGTIIGYRPRWRSVRVEPRGRGANGFAGVGGVVVSRRPVPGAITVDRFGSSRRDDRSCRRPWR